MTHTSIVFCPFLIKQTNKQTENHTHTQSSFTVLEAAATFGGMKARQTIFDYREAPFSVFTIPVERCCVVMD